MIPEYKNLVIKDITARLSYNVKCKILETNETKILASINYDRENTLFDFWEDYRKIQYDYQLYLSEFKPYLFPLSSITEEQSIELFNLFGISLVDSIVTDYIKINECTGITFFLDKGFDIETHLDKLLDWLNKNHFDYRGLIERGLAIDATGLNIY